MSTVQTPAGPSPSLRGATRGRTPMRERAGILYGVAVAIVVAASSAVVARVAAGGGVAPIWEIVVALSALPLGAVYAGRLARPVVARLVGPVDPWLPRLGTPPAIPDEFRTLVVLPAIVASPERARELLDRLARLAREHDDPNIRFALLADFADAPEATASTDAEILREEERSIDRVNAELRDESGDRVFVLHRERAWYPSDRQWIGWERKRGKLVELYRLLLGDPRTRYRWTFGRLAPQLDAGGFPYVYVVDEANWLPRGQVLSLLRVAAHPANRAQLDRSGRLVHGYAIFQPAVVPASLADGNDAPLSALLAGTPGGSGRFHFDVLGVGIFQGKGLLDVRACHALLDDVFPDAEVLQHDPMEGFVARTAEVHDAFILEAQAPGYLAQVQRGHRWLRGTFQMLRWTLPRTRGADGVLRRNPFTFVHRLFIVELALTELARPASLALLVAGWLALQAHAWLWTIVVYPPLALLIARTVAAMGSGIASRVRRVPAPVSGDAEPARAPRSLGVAAFATLFSLATLPYEAVTVVDALCRAAWRLLVSRRGLIEWPSVSRVRAATAARATAEYRRILWVCLATGIVTAVSVAALRPAHLFLALPFAALWMCAPSLVAWLDGSLVRAEAERAPATSERLARAPTGEREVA